ncbi:uncharacterized protein [Hemitrygon akajei]|uniref:uncharacterized protein n=1 Tax=Hemitrygon akajei TaxID=2704970 RepID=UPI003BF97417
MSTRSSIKSLSKSSSSCDRGSRASSKATQARAKAEAAKVRARFAKEELEVKMKAAAREAENQKEKAAREAEATAREAENQKEKAAREAEAAAREAENELERKRVEARLEALKLEREAAAAEVEAELIEDAEEMHDPKDGKSTSEKIGLERTRNYVQSQMEWKTLSSSPYLFDNVPLHEESWRGPTASRPSEEDNLPSQLRDEPRNARAHDKYFSTPNLPDLGRREAKTESRPANPITDVRPQSCTCGHVPSARTPPADESAARYFARRDLVTSGLYRFDDKPENYRAWYSTFTNAIDGFQLRATQELDLMAKWLGKESCEQVRRMRSVYINKPELALKKAWERLQEGYGAPEIIEAALCQRLGNFPKVSAKDHTKLREFGDLLMEIQGAKEDGHSAGLVYLDTPTGIRQLVDKLPFGLQDRWLSVASDYKEEHKGQFPPFEYFTRFVCKEAKKRNDPSLIGPGSSTIYTKPDKSTSNNSNITKPVSALKTEVLTTNNDSSKNCPLHNKPHPLKRCRTFREKPLEERKALLEEKGICFRCCSSTSHCARECTIAVKCLECDSTNHDWAMHPGPSPQTDNAPSPPQQDGGEGEAHSRTTVVSSSCTEVCGQAHASRSCSKICLTKVYPKGAKDKAIKAYVILDDQSNRSLVSPKFFNLFNIESEQFPYYLRTCSGNMKTYGRRAEGFQIESLDGKVLICLPPLVECEKILNNRTEIPTPSAVLHQPHLHHIAKHIPELDPEAEILLLLGRDVLRVHKVRQQVNGPHDAPFAQRLDLGWVVIGEVCPGNEHKSTANTLKTNVLESSRHTILQPRTSSMCVQEAPQGFNKRKVTDETLGQSVFAQKEHDNKLAPSAQDATILKTEDTKVFRDKANSGVAPLPFREPRQCLPNNKEQAVKRFTPLQKTTKRRPEMQQSIRSTHEVLGTPMAEVTAIMNARPLLPVSSDPENPFILSPSMLLTQKAGAAPPPGDFSDKDLYTKQWRRDLQVGDLVLLKDKQIAGNCWPMARITATFPSRDGHVREVELKTTDQGDGKIYQRPVTEVILLLPND